MSQPRPLLAAFHQALNEAWAGGAGALLPSGFFAGAALLTPLSIGTDPLRLSAVASGVLWVALALSALVTMERLFQADLEDGTLALWLGSEADMGAVAAVKTLAHWIVSGLPLVALAPLINLLFGASVTLTTPLAYGLGGLVFFYWGGVGASLAAGVRRGGLLIALIALPLYVPAAIFGAGVTLPGGPPSPAIWFLGAMALFTFALAPFAMGAALRLAAE